VKKQFYKKNLGIDVLTATRERISFTFNKFEKICVSFSGGKDSTVMLHLVMDEAKKRKRKVGVLFVDLEAQYKLTIDHVEECYNIYKEWIEPFWVSLPLKLRNAVSMMEPRWECWDPDKKEAWVRQSSAISIIDGKVLPFFKRGMEFEEFVDDFGVWYGNGSLTACLIGIRSDESLNRYRTLVANKTKFENKSWTTFKNEKVYNVYPIYDWRTEDLWIYTARENKCYNILYDRMYQAGLSIHQMRICQPYGDDQRKGLWLYHIIEPETWGKVVARVAGANSGSLYSQDKGNILGRYGITKPQGHTWKSFAQLLLDTMPVLLKEHYKNKIAVFLKWYTVRGYSEDIPDEADINLEADKKVPSWRRICKALLRNDYWFKGLSFTQTKSDTYEQYKKRMTKKREEWKII
jgi:predicted phosphoadenosine phosphosulfate sulfurtransferase